jgi:hypothetical protein
VEEKAAKAAAEKSHRSEDSPSHRLCATVKIERGSLGHRAVPTSCCTAMLRLFLVLAMVTLVLFMAKVLLLLLLLRLVCVVGNVEEEEEGTS